MFVTEATQMNSLKNKNASKLSWIKSAFSGWLVAAGAGRLV